MDRARVRDTRKNVELAQSNLETRLSDLNNNQPNTSNLEMLLALQQSNPTNKAIADMAINEYMNVFGGGQEQQTANREQQVIDSLINAQTQRYAETGDQAALDAINNLLYSENPLGGMANIQAQDQSTAGLMNQAQQQFDKGIQPYLQTAIGASDAATADLIAQLTPDSLQQLQNRDYDIEQQALEEAHFRQTADQFGGGFLGDLGARFESLGRGINPGRWERLQQAPVTASDRAKALQRNVRDITSQ